MAWVIPVRYLALRRDVVVQGDGLVFSNCALDGRTDASLVLGYYCLTRTT